MAAGITDAKCSPVNRKILNKYIYSNQDVKALFHTQGFNLKVIIIIHNIFFICRAVVLTKNIHKI